MLEQAFQNSCGCTNSPQQNQALASGCWLHEPRADCITRWGLELEGSTVCKGKQSENPPCLVAIYQNKYIIQTRRFPNTGHIHLLGQETIKSSNKTLVLLETLWIFLGQVRRFCCQRCGKFGKEPRRPRLSSARVSWAGKRLSKTAHVTVPLYH